MTKTDARPKLFHEVRLSRHFVLSDFLQSPAVFDAQIPFSLSDITHEQIRAGRSLCEDLLEPLMAQLGPCSVAAGLCPTRDHCRGHHSGSPHSWSYKDGAAADVVFHCWVNAGKPPIKIVEHLHRAGIGFERLISYAGSEFLCLNYKLGKSSRPMDHRCMVLENIRQSGQKHQPKKWAMNAGRFIEQCGQLPDRPEWRRNESELPSNNKKLRPHHIRVGKYFTLSDFCRSPSAYESGTWMASAKETPQTGYARMAAEILDPLVEAVGRVSVVRGLMPEPLASKEEHPSLWTWREGFAAVEVLMPLETDRSTADSFLTHPMIEKITSSSVLSGITLLIGFRPFRSLKKWSSAQPNVRYEEKNTR